MINKVILNTLGNRALAERAAKKYSYDSQGAKNFISESASFKRRKIFLFPIGCVLAALYLVALSLNLHFLQLVYFLKCGGVEYYKKYMPRWRKLAEHWAKYPSCFVHKATEAALYQDFTPADVSQALEIGVYTGETSRGFFVGKQLAVGVEYNIERFLQYKHAGKIHQHLYCTDIRNLPFVDESFSDVYCIHSIDDMELPAEQALLEMSRVTRRGGGVYFSGMTRNFMRHNLLILLLESLGLRQIANFLFQFIYIGSFNHFNRDEWQGILKRSGLELVEYRTYVPFEYAGIFDLSCRPENILVNLCGWRQWLLPLSQTNFFQGILFRSAAAMLYLSRHCTHRREGIYFFTAARRIAEASMIPCVDFSPEASLKCICCGNQNPRFISKRVNEIDILECRACKSQFPLAEGIPIFLTVNNP